MYCRTDGMYLFSGFQLSRCHEKSGDWVVVKVLYPKRKYFLPQIRMPWLSLIPKQETTLVYYCTYVSDIVSVNSSCAHPPGPMQDGARMWLIQLMNLVVICFGPCRDGDGPVAGVCPCSEDMAIFFPKNGQYLVFAQGGDRKLISDGIDYVNLITNQDICF